MEINKIYKENCIDTMAKMPNGFVDLVVTSPPYDNLREYNGYVFDFETIAKELYRITKVGGIIVWVVGDATINGSESGTSFRQALYFMQCGFKLHDTMIYKKNSSTYTSSINSNRYSQIFEYMFVFSKDYVKTHNLICDKKNKWAGHTSFDGKSATVKEFGVRNNIWEYVTSFNDKTEHPAVFPEYLASDHIKTWSNENDLVYDCFGGSGTTAKMAHLLNRNWILSEISEEYVNLANKRLQPYINQQILF